MISNIRVMITRIISKDKDKNKDKNKNHSSRTLINHHRRIKVKNNNKIMINCLKLLKV